MSFHMVWGGAMKRSMSMVIMRARTVSYYKKKLSCMASVYVYWKHHQSKKVTGFCTCNCAYWLLICGEAQLLHAWGTFPGRIPTFPSLYGPAPPSSDCCQQWWCVDGVRWLMDMLCLPNSGSIMSIPLTQFYSCFHLWIKLCTRILQQAFNITLCPSSSFSLVFSPSKICKCLVTMDICT
jgi:hypothetical protein